MTDQNVSGQTVPVGTDGGMARRALVLPEGLLGTTPMVLHAIAEERVKQIAKGHTLDRDDGHSYADWIGLAGKYLDDADHATAQGFGRPETPDLAAYRAALIKTAAVALAAVEALDGRTTARFVAALTAPQVPPEGPAPDGDRPSDTEPPEAA
jgi:hypothetical protein